MGKTFVASPNKSSRKLPIDMIIIHATGGSTLEGALSWMVNPKSKVSAHYCIGTNGTIVQLVDEKDKAWHAGVSAWNGKHDLNECSIGIELVNLNDEKSFYPDEQIIALSELIAELIKRYPAITEERIVGHSQVAPGRKTDPGINFPWVKLGSMIYYEKTKEIPC